MTLATPDKETMDILLDLGGEKLKICYQCGTCTGVCPWNLVRDFSVRKIIHQEQLGLVDFENEDTWTCATCGACVLRCPRGVEIIDAMKAIRKVVSEMGAGKVPDSLRISIKNIVYGMIRKRITAPTRNTWLYPILSANMAPAAPPQMLPA